MAFNCDFNAPMFVDFDNLDGEENADEFFGKLFQKTCFTFVNEFEFFLQTPITKTGL